MPTFRITDCFGEQVTLQPRLGLYSVTDFTGQEMPGLAIILDRLGSTPEETEQYAVLTTSFGEFLPLGSSSALKTARTSTPITAILPRSFWNRGSRRTRA